MQAPTLPPTLPATGFVRIRDLCSTKGRAPQRREYTDKQGNTSIHLTGQQAPRQGLLGIGETTLREWVKQGRFPAPLKLSPCVTVWRAEHVREWLEQQGASV